MFFTSQKENKKFGCYLR